MYVDTKINTSVMLQPQGSSGSPQPGPSQPGPSQPGTSQAQTTQVQAKNKKPHSKKYPHYYLNTFYFSLLLGCQGRPIPLLPLLLRRERYFFQLLVTLHLDHRPRYEKWHKNEL